MDKGSTGHASRRRVLGFLAAMGALPRSTLAQSRDPAYPSKPVTIIVPYPPGAGTDLLGRTLAQYLQATWGQSVVVENVPGANSGIGAARVAKAVPDGHTLLFSTDNTFTSNTLLYKSLPYSPATDFVPVLKMAELFQYVAVNSEVKANSLKDLVDMARRAPDSVSYSSTGRGSYNQLLYSLWGAREGVRFLHVPYKGSAPGIASTMAGETTFTLIGRRTGAGAIASGKIRLLAYVSEKRDPKMPDVPTVDEMGYPYLRMPAWYGLFAPASTSPEVIQRIHRASATMLGNPEYLGRLDGYTIVMTGPESVVTAIRETTRLNQEMIKAAGLEPE